MDSFRDPALYLLQDDNLISASLYALDLDLDTLWRAAAPADATLRTRLLALLVHAWPQPRDPVVLGLLDQARRMLGRLDDQADLRAHSAHSASKALAT